MRKLTDGDLVNIAGTTIKGYHVEGVRVNCGSAVDANHYGTILGRNDIGHYVTWQFHLDENDEIMVYWGHYFGGDRDDALRDFDTRDKVGLQRFRVTITETLSRTAEVEAEDQNEAERAVADDFAEVEIMVSPVDD